MCQFLLVCKLIGSVHEFNLTTSNQFQSRDDTVPPVHENKIDQS